MPHSDYIKQLESDNWHFKCEAERLSDRIEWLESLQTRRANTNWAVVKTWKRKINKTIFHEGTNITRLSKAEKKYLSVNEILAVCSNDKMSYAHIGDKSDVRNAITDLNTDILKTYGHAYSVLREKKEFKNIESIAFSVHTTVEMYLDAVEHNTRFFKVIFAQVRLAKNKKGVIQTKVQCTDKKFMGIYNTLKYLPGMTKSMEDNNGRLVSLDAI